MVKPRLYSENNEEKVRVCYVLDYVFRTSMKLLHPFMPFITTEIYNSLVKYSSEEFIIISVINGVLCSVAVPILINFFFSTL